MSYNGWSNWATWNMALWVDNEEPLYRARMEAKPVDAEACKQFCQEHFPIGTPDMKVADLEDIDWEEIAEHWRDEYD